MKIKINLTWKNTLKFLIAIIGILLVFQYFTNDFIKEQYLNFALGFTGGDWTGINIFYYWISLVSILMWYYAFPFYSLFFLIEKLFPKSKKQIELEKATKEIENKYKIIYHRKKLKRLNKRIKKDENS